MNSKLSFKCFVYSNIYAALHQLVNYKLFIETLCVCVWGTPAALAAFLLYLYLLC